MKVTYFRTRRPGPEILIENAVANNVLDLFPSQDRPQWTAGSLSVGAGMPDLLVISCQPQIQVLTQIEKPCEFILAYLRTVSRACQETISIRIGYPIKKIAKYLKMLVDAKIIHDKSGVFSLSPIWREILPEIVTVEAKVKNWRKSVQQAYRNSIFAHRSFVALPEQVARRVKTDPVFSKLGIGLLAVNEKQQVYVLRRSRRQNPRVWAYYYKLAFQSAKHCKVEDYAI